jgi:Pvc16 N-terminal domain
VAGSTVVAATVLSVQTRLNRSFAEMEADDPDAFRVLPTARIVRTDDFAKAGATASSPIRFPTLSIFCYRVDVNRTMRAPWAAVAAADGSVHLPLDIHLLLTPWDSDADAELRILGATMQILEQHPVLSGPALHPLGRWQSGEAIQVLNEDLVTEDVMRTFDTLPSDFRLSVSYCLRVARIDAPDEAEHPDVTTVVRGLAASSVPYP